MREKIKLTVVALLTSMAISSNATAQDTIITTQPKGVLKTYERSGYAYYNNNGYLRRGAQTGTIDIVYAEDGVYLKDPLSKAIVGTWVKASISADSTTIVLPLGQSIAYDAKQADSVVIGLMDLDEEYEEFTEDATKRMSLSLSTAKQ